MNWNKLLPIFLFASLFWACSDGEKTAGGSTEDAGIIADLNVAGVAQKGPFVKGSAVSMQAIDCKTMELVGDKFEFPVKSDKGDFEVDDFSLPSSCAVFEVSGYYLSELTGKKSSNKITLRTVTNLKDRKNVNVNVLTSLEYARVMSLAAEKETSFAEAKSQAEKEVLESFGIAGATDENLKFEDLNIFEKGDDNAALLAVSVLTLANAGEAKLAERLDEYSAAISKNGSLDDSAKTEIANWAATAAASGVLDTIRENIESWGGVDEVPAFEKYVSAFADSVTLSSSGDGGSVAAMTSSSSSRHSGGLSSLDGDDPESSSSLVASADSVTFMSPAPPCKTDSTDTCEYGELTDSRDGQVYKTVKIGFQEWMAENLNYADSVKTPSLLGNSWCYNNNATMCNKYGRLYTWMAAIDSVKLATDSLNPQNCGYNRTCSLPAQVQGICPSGWHLPDTTDWKTLVATVGDWSNAGKALKSVTGWLYFESTDSYGFSALPGGFLYRSGTFDVEGSTAYLWVATENVLKAFYAYSIVLASDGIDSFSDGFKDNAYSVRCVKN